MAKPIITTDWIGCRETIDDGVTGFLCNTRDATDLAQKMEQVMLLPQKERQQMGLKGRQKMMFQFDENIILQRYLNVIQAI